MNVFPNAANPQTAREAADLAHLAWGAAEQKRSRVFRMSRWSRTRRREIEQAGILASGAQYLMLRALYLQNREQRA